MSLHNSIESCAETRAKLDATVTNDIEPRMLHAVASYLTEKGYSVLVISADRVQHGDDGNYEFVLRFTGKRK